MTYDDRSRGSIPEFAEEECTLFMMCELKHALSKLNDMKAAGPDKVVIEHLKAMDEETLKIVLNLCNNIYKFSNIPEDILKSTAICNWNRNNPLHLQ